MSQTFTPAEANRTLPLVKRIVADILSKGRELTRLAPDRAKQEAGDRIQALEQELRDHMLELERIGCSYKDFGFKLGLVDFPASIEGEEVFLCWRSDEQSVAFYHRHSDGYAGRQGIPAELLKEG